jgi:hypothetical protein
VPLLACGSSHSASPDGKTPDGSPDSTSTTSVEVDIDQAPLLIVFRDGLDQPWQAATMMSSTRYKMDVHGPYVVAMVTDDSADPSYHVYTTRWFAQTPADDHTLNITTKDALEAGSAVIGTMVQAGRIYLGDDLRISSTPDWDFHMLSPAGPHDLFAFSDDYALVRHAVDTTQDVALGTLDLSASGVALQQVAFTATNLGASETLNGRAAIETATTSFATVSHYIPANMVRVVPDSALASGDRQTVSVVAIDGGHSRFLRKPYHAGVSTSFTLPNLLGGGSFAIAPDPTFSWTTVASAFTSFGVAVLPNTGTNYYDLSVTPSFLAATGVDHLALDAQLPGYQQVWKPDMSTGYDLAATVQTVDGDQIETEVYDHPVTSNLRFTPSDGARPWGSSARVRLRSP